MKKVRNRFKRSILRLKHFVFVKSRFVKAIKREAIVEIIELITPSGITEQFSRVGSENDGGYLVPVSAQYQDVLVSPGVSSNSSFELSFADRGTRCILFDASVLGPSKPHMNIEFHKKFWGLENTDNTINAIEWLSASIDESQRNALQMDIEGAEYSMINNMPIDILGKFNLVVIEVHGFQRILKSNDNKGIIKFFKKITQMHKVVHFHPNNNIGPVRYEGVDIIDCFELTLVRNDYPYFSGLPSSFQLHDLDMPCVPEEAEISVNWGQLK